MTTNASHVESGAGSVVDSCLDRAQAAMNEIADYDQEQVDELVQAIGWAIYEEERAREISEVAVRDTGFGNVEDKITKKRRKTAGTLDDLLGAPSVGVIDRNEEAGLTEIAKPVGVVGAVVLHQSGDDTREPRDDGGQRPQRDRRLAVTGRSLDVRVSR